MLSTFRSLAAFSIFPLLFGQACGNDQGPDLASAEASGDDSAGDPNENPDASPDPDTSSGNPDGPPVDPPPPPAEGSRRLVPEFEEHNAVIVGSGAVLSFGVEEIAEAVLAAGAQVLVTMPAEYDPQDEASLRAVVRSEVEVWLEPAEFVLGEFTPDEQYRWFLSSYAEMLDGERSDLVEQAEQVFAQGDGEAALAYVLEVNEALVELTYERFAGLAEDSRVTLLPTQLDFEDEPSIWVRDDGPLLTEDARGRRGVPYQEGKFNAAAQLTKTEFVRVAEEQGRGPFELRPMNRIAVGGAIMTNGDGTCVLGGALALEIDEPAYLDELSCATIIEEQSMPYEATGHVDMWAKFVDETTIMISEVDDESMQRVIEGGNEEHISQHEEIIAFFESQADLYDDMGFDVIRIPMPAVAYLDSAPTVLSYANATFVNTAGKQTVLLPHYTREYWETVVGDVYDANRLEELEAEAAAAFRQVGYEVIPVKTNIGPSLQGSVHCMTMQTRW